MPDSSPDPSGEPAETLATALLGCGIEIPPPQVDLLDHYRRLLWDWNERINLTRHTTYQRFVQRDIVDSRAFERLLAPGERVLDVGTGGGVPGIPLAILRPDLNVALCESVGKKARAVAQMVAQLGLDVEVHHARVESLLERARYDSLVIRAVASLRKLLTWLRPHRQQFGRLLIIKGPKWIEERGEARHYGLMKGLALRKLSQYVSGEDGVTSVVLGIWPTQRP